MKRDEFVIRMRFADSDVKKIFLGSINGIGARNYQEDSFGFSSIQKEDVEECGFAAVVADGMGGLSGGDQVSAYVVSSMLDTIKNSDKNTSRNILLSRSLCHMNSSVVSSDIHGGSTAVAAWCTSNGIYWCAVGDSRIYLFREGRLTSLNEDGDYMNQLIERVISGEMTFDEAGSDSKKDALAQYIGFKDGIVPEGNAKPLIPQDQDKLLLCTDGVYNALSEMEISGSMYKPANEAAADIQERILSKGYSNQDNFTAVVLEFVR